MVAKMLKVTVRRGTQGAKSGRIKLLRMATQALAKFGDTGTLRRSTKLSIEGSAEELGFTAKEHTVRGGSPNISQKRPHTR